MSNLRLCPHCGGTVELVRAVTGRVGIEKSSEVYEEQHITDPGALPRRDAQRVLDTANLKQDTNTAKEEE